MSSSILNSLIGNDKAFSVNFPIIDYEKSINSHPILDIWKEIIVKIKQEEKKDTLLFVYHAVKVSDSLESISEFYYTTPKYWWLILVANDAIEPFDFLKDSLNADNPIKVLKAENLEKVLSANTSLDIMGYLGVKNAR